MAGSKYVVLYFYWFLVGMAFLSVNGNRRQGRTNPTVRTTPTTEINMDAFQEFIPTAPSPQDVNCYVEVNVLQMMGGKCIRLGRSQMWSCQSGVYVGFSNECERLHRRRSRTKPRLSSQRP